MFTKVAAMTETRPAPIADDQTFGAAVTSMNNLRTKQRDIQAELADVEARLQELLIEDADAAAERRAIALVEHGQLDEGETLQGKAERLRRDLAMYRRAVALQSAKVADARAEATAKAALALRPGHREAVMRILQSLSQLRAAIDDERKFHDQLTELGYSRGLMDFSPPLSILRDDDMVVRAYLEGARKYTQ